MNAEFYISKIGEVTPQFISENVEQLVWLQDSWLSMRGITDDPDLRAFANGVALIKETARKGGWEYPL